MHPDAGIGDYASKASSSVAPHKKIASTGSRLELSPTFAHHALAAVAEKGLIGNWVQQNHDRLAQKAGFPQAKLNEIHGAWGDSKNQVKMMDDTLRHDLLQWLLSWSLRARLCVSLGTSLCGMTSDEIPNAVAERYTQGEGEGLVAGLSSQRFLSSPPYCNILPRLSTCLYWGHAQELCREIHEQSHKPAFCEVDVFLPTEFYFVPPALPTLLSAGGRS